LPASGVGKDAPPSQRRGRRGGSGRLTGDRPGRGAPGTSRPGPRFPLSWCPLTAHPIITLTTDFGTGSPFVAAVKGVILSVNPAVRLVDLGHAIPPFDLKHAAFFLREAIPYFPPGTVHVIVVDPGVGSDRSVLFAEVAGQRLLVPDNGCWALFAQGQE